MGISKYCTPKRSVGLFMNGLALAHSFSDRQAEIVAALVLEIVHGANEEAMGLVKQSAKRNAVVLAAAAADTGLAGGLDTGLGQTGTAAEAGIAVAGLHIEIVAVQVDTVADVGIGPDGAGIAEHTATAAGID